MVGRRLLVAGAVLGALAIIAVPAVWLLYGRIGAWVFTDKVVPRVEARLGRKVAIGAIEVHAGEVVLRDVVVPGDDGKPLVAVGEIRAGLAFWPSLIGDVELGEVALAGVRVTATRRKDGDNYSALVARLRGGGGGDRGGGSHV